MRGTRNIPTGRYVVKKTSNSMTATAPQNAKEKLLDASMRVIREKGYAGMSVDDLCAAAGVTKGAFFHHFESKEQLAIAAAEHFFNRAEVMFAADGYRSLADPVDRLLAYVDLRKSWLQGELPEFTCVLGTLVQETYATHPAIRDACGKALFAHAAEVETIIREAMQKYRIKADWTAKSLAAHTQAVVQGAFILAKAQNGPAVARESLDHLRRYIEMIFGRPARRPLRRLQRRISMREKARA
jgi:TetR/AcrR family transcriptional regulator, transcriptional repressor for nem operon